MATNEHLTDEEINALVQYEAGNTEYFQLTSDQADQIWQKIKGNDINEKRYAESKLIYEEISSSFRKPVRINYLSIAAVVSLLLLAAGYIYYNNMSGQSAATELLASDVFTNEELLAVEYSANEEFENYVNFPMRSGRSEIILPSNNTVFSSGISFEWNIPAEMMTVKIFNNQQDLQLEAKQLYNSYILNKELKSGLYYWTIENENEIVHWGKFYIKR